jgi:hypothetical protein
MPKTSSVGTVSSGYCRGDSFGKTINNKSNVSNDFCLVSFKLVMCSPIPAARLTRCDGSFGCREIKHQKQSTTIKKKKLLKYQ